MRTFFICVLLSLLVPALALAQGTWTVLIYCAVDDEDPAIEDDTISILRSLSEVGPPAGVRVLAQVDRSKKVTSTKRSAYQDPDYSGAKRYEILKDKWTAVAKIGEVNCGDPRVLYDFIQWGMNEGPADHLLLIVKSHGSGTMSWRGIGAVGSTQPGEVRLDLNPYTAYDAQDNDCLTLFEIAKVLEVIREKRGKPFELFMLDTCYSTTVEALYQLRNGCDILLGSEGTTLMGGFRYGGILSALKKDPASSAETLANVITKGYIDEMSGGSHVIGAFKTSASEELTGTVERLAQEMLRAQKEVGSFGLKNLTVFDKRKMYWDLKRIAERIADPSTDLKGASNSSELRQAARDVLEARKSAVVPNAMWYMGDYADQKVGGLSIYWPDAETYKKHRSFYRALPFSVATHWDEFLDLRLLGGTTAD